MVIYNPTQRELDLEVMSSDSERLIPGKVYKVAEVTNGYFVVVEGYSHPGGGLFWTQFKPVSHSEDHNLQ